MRRVVRHLHLLYDVRRNIDPLDARTVLHLEEHTTHEHYTKVVSTPYRVGKSSMLSSSDAHGDWMATSRHWYKSSPSVPSAKFSYDV